MIGRQTIILAIEIIVGISIMILVIASFLFYEDTGPMSYNELISDIEDAGNVSSLKSYADGDIIKIRDKVDDILYFRIAENRYKIIVLEDFKDSRFQLCFKGNQDLECLVGKECDFEVHVKDYNISGHNVIWLEEWYNFYDIFFGIDLYLSIDFNSEVKDIINDLSQTTQNDVIDITKSQLIIDEIIGYTNPEKSVIEYLSLTVRTRAGTNYVNLTIPKINISINKNSSTYKLNKDLITKLNTSGLTVLFNTPIKEDSKYKIIDNLTSEDFGIITIDDLDESVIKNYTLEKGDRINLILSIKSINSEIQGLIPSNNIEIYFDYGFDLGKKYEIISPVSYTLRLVKLQ
jgi:archaellin